ncbi:hypothetical protein FA13DRAFT_1709962 [Coprinellus micaceus]|uniref:Uncharacterized protein n=1 Tax=Coprinellus micaceus TaxID=71717 RepID=A0A4Y7TC20_COPMI|nr:hypothetical protein FA13DRAFT_1709962 [Coprinellus micaceus]
MPATRPGWNVLQSLELHVAGIELLGTIENGEDVSTFLDDWWVYWYVSWGIPKPRTYQEIVDITGFITEYQWNSPARVARMRRLRHGLLNDIEALHVSGIDLNVDRPAHHTTWFADTIRVFRVMEHLEVQGDEYEETP